MSSGPGLEQELEWLLGLREASPRGVVPAWAMEAAAYRLGYSTGHLRRLVRKASGSPPPHQPWAVNEWVLGLWYAHGGNLSALHDDLLATRAEIEASGGVVPAELAEVPAAYPTFWMAFDRLPLRYREFNRRGSNGVRQRLISLRWQASARNEIWQADSCWLDIWITPRRSRNPRRPWLLVFLDDRHRLIVGAMLCLTTPGTSHGAAGLARAVQLKTGPGSVVYGGQPGRILVDNGSEWRNQLMTMIAIQTGIRVTPVMRHTPTHKGKVERFFYTLQRWALAGLPGYIKSPELSDGRRVFEGNPDDLLNEEQLWSHLTACIDHYNWERVHRSLGSTPGASWAHDPTPLIAVSPDVLRSAVLWSPNTRVAHGDGVRYRNRVYLAVDGTYDDWIGRQVHVGYLPHDHTFVEIASEAGEWICTAYEQGNFSADEVHALVRRRSAQLDQIESAAAVAARLGAARIARLTGPPKVERSVVSLALGDLDRPGTGLTDLPAITEAWLAATEQALDPEPDDG